MRRYGIVVVSYQNCHAAEISAGVRKKVPGDAPRSYVMPRWTDHVATSTCLDRQSSLWSSTTSAIIFRPAMFGCVAVANVGNLMTISYQQLYGKPKNDGRAGLAVLQSFTAYLDQQSTASHKQLPTVNNQLAAETLPDVIYEWPHLYMVPTAGISAIVSDFS